MSRPKFRDCGGGTSLFKGALCSSRRATLGEGGEVGKKVGFEGKVDNERVGEEAAGRSAAMSGW